MKIYVGNLPFSTTEDELRELFESHGEVASAEIVRDRDSGRSRGFGFVEMGEESQARAAIEGLDGTELSGRALVVNEARSKEPRGGR